MYFKINTNIYQRQIIEAKNLRKTIIIIVYFY